LLDLGERGQVAAAICGLVQRISEFSCTILQEDSVEEIVCWSAFMHHGVLSSQAFSINTTEGAFVELSIGKDTHTLECAIAITRVLKLYLGKTVWNSFVKGTVL
jgi:hypothetical protein